MTSAIPESPDMPIEPNNGAGDEDATAADRAAGQTPWRQASGFRSAAVITAAVALLVGLAMATGSIGGNAGPDGVDDSGASGAVVSEGGVFALPFTTADGGTGTLADYHGQPLVVNFFASWCPPCRAELPDFEAVHQRLGDDVTFVGVNQDFTEESWRSFVAEAQISYDTVFQPQSEIWSEIATQAMPTTVFISADGEIERVWAGLITDDKLEEVIDETLLEPTS